MANRFAGYVPARVHWHDERPVVDWRFLGERTFREPFFEDTVRRARREPAVRARRLSTPIEALGEWHAAQPGLPPSGFIFHMSRCGSTLLAQLLATLPQHVVISEAEPLDFVLRCGTDQRPIDDAERVRWLQWLISALGQPRRGGETRLFVKFDSWSVFSLPLIRRAFPTVPWIFLHRDPGAVIASHLRCRGSQMVPQLLSPAYFGITPDLASALPAQDYIARVLASICAAVLPALEAGAGRAVHFADLPGALCTTLAGHWHLAFDDADIQRMAEAAQFDAKDPGEPFAAQQDPPAHYEAANRLLRPLYDRLLRLS